MEFASVPPTDPGTPPPPPGPAPVPVQPPWAGPGARKLGRYRLGPLLGKGGMGEVFQAWDSLLDRPVALKCLTVPHAEAVQRFLREARLQARVTHPNVCRIYDVDASGAVPFIAMQLVQGPNLLQAAPDLTVDQAVEILHAVALAINAAHRLNLIHRDVKPSNVLLEPDGMGGWNTLVADFGLAKDLGQEEPSNTLVPMGTPEYMAPEQRSGDPEAMGPAVDVYALGATLRVVVGLAEDAERNGRTDNGASRAWVRDYPGASTLRALPRRLRLIAARCLEERPQDRYLSAGELAEDLRRYLDREPLLAQRGFRLRKVRRALDRHRALVAALAVCLVLGSGFALGARFLAARSRRRAALSQRFALDARDLENRMRIERLIPAHDLRPVRAQMLGRLERMRRDLAALGPDAQGPGDLALGRGYAAVGELNRALATLEAAWDGGYAAPEAAYALCRVHTDYCLRLADATWGGGAGAAQDAVRTAHLRAARMRFAQAAGASWEPRELGEAALLVQEGAFAAGLDQARRVFQEAPWRYEAKVQEARALVGMARERADRKEIRAALSLVREAELAAQAAQAIGQSDDACCLAELEARLVRLDLQPAPLPAALAAWAGAEGLVDRALAIDPDNPLAQRAKVYVVLGRAAALVRARQDPEAQLRRAERYLAPWVASSAQRPAAALSRCRIQYLRARYRMERGTLPGRELGWALEEREGGIWTLEALVLQARWLARWHRDPGPWLQAFWARQGAGLPAADQARLEALRTQARQRSWLPR